MNTILIVEDNDFERNALQHFVDWDLLGLRVVAAACNGRDGLELARQHKPDIILSDVMMPAMNGIEMAKAIAQVCPNAKFIFASGHDDVGLLKEALEIRAYSYLIKPVRPEELVAALKKIAAVATDEKFTDRARLKIIRQLDSNLHHLQSKFLEELMIGTITPPLDVNELYARAHDLKLRTIGAYKLALVELDWAGRGDVAEQSACLHSLLQELAAATAGSDVLFLKRGDNRIAVVLHSLKSRGSSDAVVIGPFGADPGADLLREIESKLAPLAEEKAFRYVIGVSDAAPNLTDLGALYRQCCAALEEKFGFGYGRVIPFEQHRKPQAASPAPDKGRIRTKVDELAATVCDGHDGEEGLYKLLSLLTAEYGMKLERVQTVMIALIGSLARQLAQTGEHIERIAKDEMELVLGIVAARTLPDIAASVRETLRQVSAYTARKQLTKEDAVIREVVGILHRDYAQPVTLAYLSERVYLSSNYLRILFKEKMNISIQDYLTNLRINKAKELLRESRYKIHEIGAMAGYENSTYFNLVFKNSVQMTPGEYRNKFATLLSV